MNLTSLSSKPVARPSRIAAFTLVELLTVIAIIGVLAAILIPTVGAVRASAHQSACSTNLRQLSLAVIMYAKDNRDQLPSARDASGNWLGIYRSVRDPSPGASAVSFVESSRQLSYHVNNYLDAGRTGEIWRCPGNIAAQEASTASNSSNRLSYMVNNRGLNFANATNPPAFFGRIETTDPAQARPKRLNEIVAAARDTNGNSTPDGKLWREARDLDKIWMLSDLDSTNYGGTDGIPAAGDANAVPMPHKGGRIYAFFDGHVEHRKANNLPANP